MVKVKGMVAERQGPGIRKLADDVAGDDGGDRILTETSATRVPAYRRYPDEDSFLRPFYSTAICIFPCSSYDNAAVEGHERTQFCKRTCRGVQPSTALRISGTRESASLLRPPAPEE